MHLFCVSVLAGACSGTVPEQRKEIVFMFTRLHFHRYDNRTPDIWLVTYSSNGTVVREYERSRPLHHPRDPSLFPSPHHGERLNSAVRPVRKATRPDSDGFKQPKPGQGTPAWETWKSAENPTSEQGALNRAQQYGHGKVVTRKMTPKDVQDHIRMVEKKILSWYTDEYKAQQFEHIKVWKDLLVPVKKKS